MIFIRGLSVNDEPYLAQFLALAAHEDDVQIVLSNPNLARYVESFGRAGDYGVVAQRDEQIVGMAWARLWTPENRGFGWIDEATPEMAIAVESQFCNQGVGTRLIEALKVELRAAGATQISLNVRADSPAVRLYQRSNFVKVHDSERTNRTGGVSFNMLAPLG